jgi:hypothetical protein
MWKPPSTFSYMVVSWDSRDPAPRSLIATAYQLPLAASLRYLSRASSAAGGRPSASASSLVTAPRAPVTEACMLKMSAVAPLPRASSYATRA